MHNRTRHDARPDAIVVGGGLAGLTAAATLARAGRSVVLFERGTSLGGRAATTEESGFALNLGPHALYERGAAIATLRDLGIDPAGASPGTRGAWVVADGRRYRFPATPLRLLTTGLLSLGDRLETARVLAALPRTDAAALVGTPFTSWLGRTARRPRVRALVAALARLSTYCADLDLLDAGAGVAQIQSAVAGVRYVDGGWTRIVDALRGAAIERGARIEARARATAVERADGRLSVRLADGHAVETGAVVLAVSPAEATAMLPENRAVASWASAAVPIRAAALDLGLSALPRSDATFALGLDRDDYLSVHSAVARLAPDGAAVVHVMRYLRGGDRTPAREVDRELEALADLAQPGWRDRVAVRRYLPSMVVSNALVTAEAGGLDGRPGPDVPGEPGVYVAGDWVGRTGMLADAALASARCAAERAIEALARERAEDRVLEAIA